ncbi:MAG: 50S ribosomal protein L18 [Parcubacteria group bacterium]|nr:50S ribosomal protein L18 [Parcubacteria group bacterium]
MNRKIQKTIQHQRGRRAIRVRSKIGGTAARPRLAVHRSLRYISAQLIDDVAGKTLAAAHQRDVVKGKATKTEAAAAVGKAIAEAGKKAGVSQVVFDRRSYRYHGRVKAAAEAAREAGLQF